jgi:peptidoglycan hydrolase-like protein with peptidoglycan-binding domain
MVSAARGYQAQRTEKPLGTGGTLTVSDAPTLAPTRMPSAAGSPLTIRLAQIRLAELNLYSGAIDGQMGSATLTALKTFQRVRGLPESGALDAATSTALQSR